MRWIGTDRKALCGPQDTSQFASSRAFFQTLQDEADTPGFAHARRRGSAAADGAEAAERFCCAIVDRVAGRVAVVKPQIAFFEQLGWPGIRALTRVVERARAAGLLVLLDAKRGDIGSTAAGYAAADLQEGAPIEVDAVTLDPYLGLDTLEPFADVAQSAGRGLVVLIKTSNPGSGAVS